jgi:ABC-2 type transport system permease protein
MTSFLTLMQREWLQHRFGWTLLTLVPLGLALLLFSVGHLQFDQESVERMGDAFPAIVTAVAILGGTALSFIIVALTSLILVNGLARRDHQDRSIEFWLSLPIGHSSSLAAPLLMHLLVAPAAALFVGLAGGWLLSLVVVTRLSGFSAWLALPWGDIVAAVAAMLARVMLGLPLALLWVAPLVLAQVLANAYFKRWGLPVLLLLLVAGGLLVDRWLGMGSVSQLIGSVLRHAGQALVATGNYKLNPESAQGAFQGLRHIPGWALNDLAGALRAVASPLFAGCLLSAAALFALLVDWRRRGAGAAG